KARKLCLGQARKAPDIDAVHLSDRRVGSDSERAHAAVLAEVVLVLARIEEVLRQFALAGQEPESALAGDGRPEPRAPADRAVAQVRRLGQVEVRLEPDGAAMATALVGLQHFGSCFSSKPRSPRWRALAGRSGDCKGAPRGRYTRGSHCACRSRFAWPSGRRRAKTDRLP